MIIIGLILSVCLNVLLIWYLKKILEKLMFVSDSLGGLFDSVNVYREHVKSVYELEVFYGDETLQSLITHTKELHEELEQFEHVYSLTDADEDNAEGDMEYDEEYDEEPGAEAP
tara:strand:- start:192 stop:533 length:342 start_codon:yes stop_codon:yes gene_type:complete